MSPEIASIANAMVTSMSILVYELDKAGAVSKDSFITVLRNTADTAENNAPPQLPKDRLDVKLLRRIAETIESGPDPKPQTGWVPELIQGGLDEPNEEGSN